MGAIFLMATSAIGPGFLTQTAVFTSKLGAAFAFAILVSILIDIAVQLNVWRVIGIAGQRAQELGNTVLPGLGWVLSVLIGVGSIVFNIGNIAGGGLGLNAALGISPVLGGAITALLAIAGFVVKKLGNLLDKLVVVLGALMIVLTVYIAFRSSPPLAEAAINTIAPEKIDLVVITTLVGGTVGGYITYAGAHRMLDSGESGPEHAATVSRSSISGILVTGVMRVVLFLAVLGVAASGARLEGESNPAAAAFSYAAGPIGLRIFGVVLFCAALSSVIGCSYTSASFLVSPRAEFLTRQNIITIVFIIASGALFLTVGTAPAKLLVFAGAFNGLVLPLGFTLILYIALFRGKDLLHGYRYPKYLIVLGVVALVVSWALAWFSFKGVFELLS